jgi:hypothetical protein
MAAIVAATLRRSNAGTPVSTSYMTAPNANKSVLASTGWDCCCSGAMYCMVLINSPTAVSVLVPDRASIPSNAAVSARTFAIPKSSSFAPLRVSMMLTGFRSR